MSSKQIDPHIRNRAFAYAILSGLQFVATVALLWLVSRALRPTVPWPLLLSGFVVVNGIFLWRLRLYAEKYVTLKGMPAEVVTGAPAEEDGHDER